jgi:hypothetical protein
MKPALHHLHTISAVSTSTVSATAVSANNRDNCLRTDSTGCTG